MARRPPPVDKNFGSRCPGHRGGATAQRGLPDADGQRLRPAQGAGRLRAAAGDARYPTLQRLDGDSAARGLHAAATKVDSDARRPSLITLTLLSIFVLYVQLFLGAMFRHKGMSWWPHVLNAAVVAVVLSWTAIRALTQYSRIEAVRRPAITMLSLMIAQLGLGFLAFQTRVAWGHDAIQPELPMVISTVTHVAMGALLLATAVILSIQVWRHVPVAFQERIPDRERKPVAA